MLRRSFAPQLHDVILGAFREAGLMLTVKHQASHLHISLAMVSAGLGVSILPAASQGICTEGVAYRPLDDPNAAVELGMLYRKDDPSALLQEFLKSVRDAAMRWRSLTRASPVTSGAIACASPRRSPTRDCVSGRGRAARIARGGRATDIVPRPAKPARQTLPELGPRFHGGSQVDCSRTPRCAAPASPAAARRLLYRPNAARSLPIPTRDAVSGRLPSAAARRALTQSDLSG